MKILNKILNVAGLSPGWNDAQRFNTRAAIAPFQLKTGKVKWPLLAMLLLAPIVAPAQSYSIDWYKIAGGGGTSTNGQFSITGTIGQPDASGAMSGGSYSLSGGFWSLVSVVQTAGAPMLTITHTGNTVTVSWPYPSTGWTLHQNPDLTTANWSSSGGIANDGTNNFITLTSPTGNLFFRLSNP
jgi:hypothetical protein